MKKLDQMPITALAIVALLASMPQIHATVFQEIHAFVQGPYDCEADLLQGPDGAFYGTTAGGGTNGHGTVFRLSTNGLLTVLVAFDGTNGAYPRAGLTLGPDGALYGTTSGAEWASTGVGPVSGGSGTIFRVTTTGAFTRLCSFSGTNGAIPFGRLLLAGDGSFYGTTYAGGATNVGTVFRATTSGTLTVLASFEGTNGAYPRAGLAFGPDGAMYGSTTARAGWGTSGGRPGGGVSYDGTIFRVNTNGGLTSLFTFDFTNGASPFAQLLLASNGLFYGTTYCGGVSNLGTVFSVTTNGILTSLASFVGTNGANPAAGLTLGTNGLMYGCCSHSSTNSYGTVFSITTAGSLNTVASLDSIRGAVAVAALTLGEDGLLYGSTSGKFVNYNEEDGSWSANNFPGGGGVFRYATIGSLTSLSKFSVPNGSAPQAGLTLGQDGAFYGTTSSDGADQWGTIFRIATNGSFSTLTSFNWTNGAGPSGELLAANDGTFYSTTRWGGTNDRGTIFRVATNGALATVFSFDGDNGWPMGSLVFGGGGDLYGTTPWGGSSGCGTVFRASTNGSLIWVTSFTGTNGTQPNGGLVLAPDGFLYGTTYWGGANNLGAIFRVSTGGTVQPLFSFQLTNGANPSAGLTLASDGDFYGTTSAGGRMGLGTLFSVTPNGTLSTLASFDETTGARPVAELSLGPDGALYGTCADASPGSGDSGNTGSLAGGCAFRFSPACELTKLISFTGPNGVSPQGRLTFGTDGSIYGTTSEGGSAGGGNVFRLSAWSFFSNPALTNANFEALLTGQPGLTYTVESANSLTGSWQKRTNVTTPATDQGFGIGVHHFSEPAPGKTNRYYRTVYPAY